MPTRDLTRIGSNRKPADRLADIREQIRDLEAQEQTLRSQILAGRVSLIGDEYRIVVEVKKVERIDSTKMRNELGAAFLRPYLKRSEVSYVMLEKLGRSAQVRHPLGPGKGSGSIFD